MKTSVQARLDEESAAALEVLQRSLGLSPSEIVRSSLRLMVQEHTLAAKKKPKFLGVGNFDSGLSDLATNKKYMQDFGLTRKLRLEREQTGKSS
jgi:hypothetical protein